MTVCVAIVLGFGGVCKMVFCACGVCNDTCSICDDMMLSVHVVYMQGSRCVCISYMQ